MNFIETFRDYLVSESVMTSGQVFISRAPLEPSTLWWLTAQGGADLGHFVTGESIQNTVIGIYYRNEDAKEVYDRLESLRDTLTCAGCVTLPGYELIEIPTTQGPFTDQDLDNEERTVGYLQVSLTTKKAC